KDNASPASPLASPKPTAKGTPEQKTKEIPARLPGENSATYAKRLSKLGFPKEAIAAMEQAVKENPDDPYTHRRLGDLYLASGQKKLAIAQWQEYLKLAPSDSGASKVKSDIETLSR